jgi:hypothetical protein
MNLNNYAQQDLSIIIYIWLLLQPVHFYIFPITIVSLLFSINYNHDALTGILYALYSADSKNRRKMLLVGAFV